MHQGEKKDLMQIYCQQQQGEYITLGLSAGPIQEREVSSIQMMVALLQHNDLGEIIWPFIIHVEPQ